MENDKNTSKNLDFLSHISKFAHTYNSVHFYLKNKEEPHVNI